MEINGFEIEEYNVYGLDTRKKNLSMPEMFSKSKKEKATLSYDRLGQGFGYLPTLWRGLTTAHI
jgi:hypothetical protein